MNPYFIYALPRTGSSLLAQTMNNRDPALCHIGEAFGNQYGFMADGPPYLVRRPPPWPSDEERQIDNIRRWNVLKGKPGLLIKVLWHHLERNPQILQELCEDYTPLCLIRRDCFGRVLSYVIGQRTQVWTLYSQEAAEKHRDYLRENPILPDGEVERWVKDACHEYQEYQKQIENLATKRIIYFEDLLVRPEEELRKIGYQIPEDETIQFPIPRVNPKNHLEAFQNPDQIIDWYEHYRSIA